MLQYRQSPTFEKSILIELQPRVKLLEYETSMTIGTIDESRILRARVIKECEELDLEAWRTMVKAGNQP